jgi:hypothetical protein
MSTPGWTPFPNRLLDEAMPRLRDTEWRLLCVIVRETIGRRDSDGERRKRAWLSQYLLKKTTGRESEAISRAIDVLCRSRLIEACDSLGRPMASSRARRRYQGRLRLSLHPAIQGEISQNRSSKTE